MYYTDKMVFTGDFLKIISFENKVQKRDFKLLYPVKKEKAKSGLIRKDSLVRTRTNLCDLINSNFGAGNRFILLTFRDNIQSLDEACRLFSAFVKRMNRRYPNFKYVAVPEFHLKGRVHIHLVTDLAFTDKALFENELWQYGFVKFKRIYQKKDYNMLNLGLYLSKYLTKDTNRILFGRRKFWSSRNLERPIEFFTKDMLLPVLVALRKSCSFLSKVIKHNKFRGIISYSYYRLE